MGNGSCGCYGNCSGKWWSEFSNPLLLLFSFLSTCTSLYSFITAACIYILCSSYSAFMLLQGQGPDWQDFLGIICLLLMNSTISFIEENNAGNAAASLMARLAPKAKVHSYKSKDWIQIYDFRYILHAIFRDCRVSPQSPGQKSFCFQLPAHFSVACENLFSQIFEAYSSQRSPFISNSH